jgi:cyanate permease
VAFNQAVFALAPAVLGVLRDISTSYVVPFALAAAMQIVAALIVLIRPPRRSRVDLRTNPAVEPVPAWVKTGGWLA